MIPHMMLHERNHCIRIPQWAVWLWRQDLEWDESHVQVDL